MVLLYRKKLQHLINIIWLTFLPFLPSDGLVLSRHQSISWQRTLYLKSCFIDRKPPTGASKNGGNPRFLGFVIPVPATIFSHSCASYYTESVAPRTQGSRYDQPALMASLDGPASANSPALHPLDGRNTTTGTGKKTTAIPDTYLLLVVG